MLGVGYSKIRCNHNPLTALEGKHSIQPHDHNKLLVFGIRMTEDHREYPLCTRSYGSNVRERKEGTYTYSIIFVLQYYCCTECPTAIFTVLLYQAPCSTLHQGDVFRGFGHPTTFVSLQLPCSLPACSAAQILGRIHSRLLSSSSIATRGLIVTTLLL